MGGRRPSLLLLLLLLACNAAIVQADCPKGTFTCKDGSCIPSDWVGDGEPDCDDRSDEMAVTVNGTHPAEDPFDDIVTHGPMGKEDADAEEADEAETEVVETQGKARTQAKVAVESSTSEPNDGEEKCPYTHQQRVDECSEPVILYIHQINDIYFENSSLLADKTVQEKVERGCSLMEEYNICIQGASEECVPDAGVQAWKEVEVYVCQLLLPAIREHQPCFERTRKQACPMLLDPLASPFCRLVTSIAQDVGCVQEHPGDCSDAALEMLPPIMEESIHIAESIRCRNPLDLPTTTTTETPAEEEEEEVEVGTTTARSRTVIAESTEDTQEHTTTADMDHKIEKVLSVDMTNAVNAFYYIYDVCSSDYSKSLFNGVAHMICGKQDDIAKYSDCYQKTLEKMKCATKQANTSCEALNSFNSNLDCAIVTMNDECPVEAQDLVVDIQERVNDMLIENRCFDEDKKQEEGGEEEEKKAEDDGEFHLQSKLPKCSDEQENSALACLVELVEINRQLSQLQNLNFLLELATQNSSVVASICGLYNRYEQCMQTTIFRNGTRCSSASPLNTLARIGLAPICSLDSRPLLATHRDCLVRLAEQTSVEHNCQAGLSSLGGAVNSMLQGIHGEALLCKSFYLIRETFVCGERAVKASCDAQAYTDLGKLKQQMSELGVEEGCPEVQPANLDEIIARPVKRPQPIAAPTRIPMARPLAPVTVPVSVSPAPFPGDVRSAIPALCTAQQQAQFESCVGAITKYQPHPLSVIKTPRQIDEACGEFARFKNCSTPIGCSPLWARGMTAMFEFACGQGQEKYKKIRRCLKDVSAGAVVSECVATFSRGAPNQACLSANALFSCAIGQIQTDCGDEASAWISEYVTKFATAIDPRCKLASQMPVGKVVGVGCSLEEDQIIEHCAAPLNDIGSRLEELFQGGLQNMIKNVNSLAPVFAGGCNLTGEFRTCAHFLLSGHTPCVVSSCMIEAGHGICDQPDPTQAIDDNLSCLFGQIQEPTFAKCIRSTISTVKHFSLQSLRNVLPKFLDCTEEIVLAKCGETPIKVLRAMSSPNLCPITASPIVPINRPQPTRVEPKMPVCDEKKKAHYTNCTSAFFSKYKMMPIALISISNDMDSLCSEAERMDACSVSSRVCAKTEEMAFKKTVQQMCLTRAAYEKHSRCLSDVAHKETKCMSEFLSAKPDQKCAAIRNTANCMAKSVQSKCGKDALGYTFAAMSDYARMAFSDCMIDTPSVALETGCSEDQLVQFLECESTLDRFGFRPISIITKPNKWNEFCAEFYKNYRPCVEKLPCKFEPVSTVHTTLVDSICDRPVSLRDQKKYAKCLSEFTDSEKGQQCIAPMSAVDPISSEASLLTCAALNEVLSCASSSIEEKCGYDALLHVYDLHIEWGRAYNQSCIIKSPEPKSVPTNELDNSRDAKPETAIRDETTPALEADSRDELTVDSEREDAEEAEETAEEVDNNRVHPKDLHSLRTPIQAAASTGTFSIGLLVLLLFPILRLI